MDGASLYDDDILAWSEVQATALRSLASRRDLPNQLDLANVVEEIEDAGRSELRAVESLIENILVRLVLLGRTPMRQRWVAGEVRSLPGGSPCAAGSRPRCVAKSAWVTCGAMR
jgi:hypothetical protein